MNYIQLNKGYEVLTEKFHSIEFPSFGIGLNFYSKKKAEEIKNIILNYSKALNSSLFYMYEKKEHDSFHNQKLFDYIMNPKKFINNNEQKKKVSNEINNKQIIAKTKINSNIKIGENKIDNNYLDQIFDKTIKKLNYKISSDEQMLSFGFDTESNELIFETSKGANRFLEQNNIEISIINEEYEKLKEKLKIKNKNNKPETQKIKKSLQEELKDKENKEKINEILNQIEGLQIKDKNHFNLEEEEKQKFDNKIKKFNIAKRLPINQKLQINSSPDNMIFYEDDSDDFEEFEEGEEIEDDEEGDELEEEEENEKQKSNSLNENSNSNNPLNFEMNNNKEFNENYFNNKKNLLFHSRLSIIKNADRNSSEISSNELNENNIKNSLNNKHQEQLDLESNQNEKSDKSNNLV